jgi:hypothetical protein
MKITTRFVIKAYNNGIYAAPPREVQRLFKQWWWRNWRLWSRAIDEEDIPVFVMAWRGVGGLTGWKSEFYPFDEKTGVLPADHPKYPQKSLDIKSVF